MSLPAPAALSTSELHPETSNQVQIVSKPLNNDETKAAEFKDKEKVEKVPEKGPNSNETQEKLNGDAEKNNVKEIEPITKSYMVKVVNSAPFSLFELKQSCKLNVEDFVDVKITKPEIKTINSTQPSCSDNSKNENGSKDTPKTTLEGGKVPQGQRKKKFYRSSLERPEEKQRTLTVLDKASETHKLEGHRVAINNSQGIYFVMTQGIDGTFLAHPVDGWFSFEPSLKYKTLTIEEADEEFERRDKILNYFSVMVKKRLKGEVNSDDEDEEVLAKPEPVKKKPKVSVLEEENSDPWMEESDSDEENDKVFLNQVE